MNFTFNAAPVLNTIRNSASMNYRNYVPFYAPEDGAGIKEIGKIIMDAPGIRSEFTDLFLQFARQLVSTAIFKNPFAALKRSDFEIGAIIQDIFVDMAKGVKYDGGAVDIFRKIPDDVKSAYYVLNFKALYPATIGADELREAFTTENAFQSFTSAKITSLYTAMEVDEYAVVKLLVASAIADHKVKYITHAAATSTETAREMAVTMQSNVLHLGFPTTEYNPAGVANPVKPDNVYILITPEMQARIDMQTLATAFHMDKAEISGRFIVVDNFNGLDWDRLSDILDGDVDALRAKLEDSTVQAVLASVQCVAFGGDWLKLVNRLTDMESIRNPKTLATNYFLHNWNVVAFSPFVNAFAIGTATYNPPEMPTPANLQAPVEWTSFVGQSENWNGNSIEGDDDDTRDGTTIAKAFIAANTAGIVTFENLPGGVTFRGWTVEVENLDNKDLECKAWTVCRDQNAVSYNAAAALDPADYALYKVTFVNYLGEPVPSTTANPHEVFIQLENRIYT